MMYLDNQNLGHYSHGPMVPALENPPKHRRTRSGCLTCRSRRVKVSTVDSKNLHWIILLTRLISVMRHVLLAIVSLLYMSFVAAWADSAQGCKKGNRECQYPEPQSSKRAKHAEHKSSVSASPKTDNKSSETISRLEVIKDESDEDAIGETEHADVESIPDKNYQPVVKSRSLSAQSLRTRQKTRDQDETFSNAQEKEYTPSTESSGSKSRSGTPSSVSATAGQTTAATSTTITPIDDIPRDPSMRWAHLKPTMQKYLQYQRDKMTYYHYFCKIDPTDFIHTDFIDVALSYEPLLYAVVAFAAFHHTLASDPEGSISGFLAYYSRSLTLLRRWLEKNPGKYTEGTILTVLQLATFEEYLGDWANLVGHHAAAHQMLLAMYKPDPTGGRSSIMETETTRNIFSWYTRFDVIAGLLGGNETILDRHWYVVCQDWYASHVDEDDMEDIDSRFQALTAGNRLIGMDMASLFSRMGRGQITIEDFKTQNEQLRQRLGWVKSEAQKLNDAYYTVTDFPWRKPLTMADIVDPYIPGGLFEKALWHLNFVWIDWYAIELMHQYQTSMILQEPIPVERLQPLALEQCRIYEAINRYPHAPQGAILGGHASLGLAIVFLPKDQKHIDWARHRLCEIERRGYVFPSTFRDKMAEMWDMKAVGGTSGWWLDGDEGMIPILRDMRNLAEERRVEDRSRQNSEAGTTSPGNTGGSKGIKEDLRDMRAIFSKLNIRGAGGGSMSAGSPLTGDEESPQSESTAGSAASVGVGAGGMSQSSNRQSGFSPPASYSQFPPLQQQQQRLQYDPQSDFQAMGQDFSFGTAPPMPLPVASVESFQQQPVSFLDQQQQQRSSLSLSPSALPGTEPPSSTSPSGTGKGDGRSSKRASRVGRSNSNATQQLRPPSRGDGKGGGGASGDRMSGVWSG